MEVLVEEGVTYDKCLEKIKEKYGPNITISRVENKKKGGFFGLFEKDVVALTFSIYNPPFNANTFKAREIEIKEEPIQVKTKPLKTIFPPLDDNQERLKILRRAAEQSEEMAEKVTPYIRKIESAFPEDKDQLKKLADTVSKLTEQIAEKGISAAEHENIEKIITILEDNDFTRKYIQFIVQKIKQDLSLSVLDNFTEVQKNVLNWIYDSIPIAEPLSDGKKGKTIVLIGPTGVGKTTTLAKLAAYYVKILPKEINRPVNVQVITIDEYRIGAVFQMKRYCEIMNIPLAIAKNSQELKKYIDLYKESADIICIDTTGRSPNDQKNILEMQECINVIDFENSEIYLTISSIAKASDIKEIIKQYKGFKYSALVITKLDETMYTGSLISSLYEHNIPVVYITSGQEVPRNIQRASKNAFLKKLKGFTVEENYIEENLNDEKPIVWK